LRKFAILLVAVFLCAGGIAIAAWRIVDGGGEGKASTAAAEGKTFQAELQETVSSDGEAGPDDTGAQGEEPGTSGYGEAGTEIQSGEDFSYTSPDQRYVTETQRHQNFFKALAEGRVRRLDVTATDYRPVGDPNTSYVYFTLNADSGTSNGTMVFKFEGGMWRIAAINQLQGDLDGGTNYMVPPGFEDVLAQEISELQPFLAKVAEGRLKYMAVDSVSRPGENETILSGVVVGMSGKTVPAEMRLRKDYGIWHLTYITNPP
jgi:hypothetical protein